MEIFNVSYDSFGNVSLMLLNRFSYLKKHLPRDLELFEASNYINLLELHREGIISSHELLNLKDIEEAPLTRLEIIKKIEKKCDIFIYHNDLETLVSKPKAFDSFLLAVAGQSLALKKYQKVSSYNAKESRQFIVPLFS